MALTRRLVLGRVLHAPFCAAAGLCGYAVSLSGHGGSRGRAYLDSFSISDYVDDVAEVVDKLPVPRRC
jgi:alpha-beta hydrolase superfamily lysophospholipase